MPSKQEKRAIRRRKQRLAAMIGPVLNRTNQHLLKRMIDANHQLFADLERRYGSLERVNLSSVLPHKTRPKTSPAFKQLGDYSRTNTLSLDVELKGQRTHIMFEDSKDGNRYFYAKVGRLEGNTLGFADKYYFNVTGNFWTNNPNKSGKEG